MATTYAYVTDDTPLEATPLPDYAPEPEPAEALDFDIGVWSGMPADKAVRIYKELYALGTLSPANYGIELTPFDENGLLMDDSFWRIPLFDEGMLLPWLATSVDLSILDAQVDSFYAGHYQMNFINGNGSGDIPITFIETRNASILNSAKRIKQIMFPADGTQGVPKDYLMNLKIYTFDRQSRSNRMFEIDHLVALQAGNLPLEASNTSGVATVTLTFVKMFPMLAK